MSEPKFCDDGELCSAGEPCASCPNVDHSVDATKKVTGQKFDQGKPMMSLIPPRAEMAVAEVLTFGASKYSLGNWRHVDDLERRYTDAALRHINAYRQGQQNDQESNLRHLAHAICCLMFMLEVDLESSAD